MVMVTFKSLSRTGRVFRFGFDLGSDKENTKKILDVAWKYNAEILSVERESDSNAEAT